MRIDEIVAALKAERARIEAALTALGEAGTGAPADAESQAMAAVVARTMKRQTAKRAAKQRGALRRYHAQHRKPNGAKNGMAEHVEQILADSMPLHLRDIRRKLGPRVKKASLNTLLANMVKKGRLVKSGQRPMTAYGLPPKP